MNKVFVFSLVLFLSTTSIAKQLTVSCQKDGAPDINNLAASDFGAVFQVANVHSTPVLESLFVQGVSQQQAEVSQSSVSAQQISLRVDFGNQLYNSVQLSVQNCQDSFSATGEATLALYVGGFVGTRTTPLICTCDLQ